MNFRQTASIYGAVAAAAGLLMMAWGPLFLPSLGSLVQSDFGSYSLIRLAGVGFLLAGAVLLAVRTVRDLEIQRRVSLAMVGAHVIAALVVLAQQTAIWDSRLGIAIDASLWLAALGFTLVLVELRRVAAAAQA